MIQHALPSTNIVEGGAVESRTLHNESLNASSSALKLQNARVVTTDHVLKGPMSPCPDDVSCSRWMSHPFFLFCCRTTLISWRIPLRIPRTLRPWQRQLEHLAAERVLRPLYPPGEGETRRPVHGHSNPFNHFFACLKMKMILDW